MTIDNLGPGTLPAIYEATTDTGSRYILDFRGYRWEGKRYPGPGAPARWLDGGAPLGLVRVEVGHVLRVSHPAGYGRADVWFTGSVVVDIVRLPDDVVVDWEA